MQLAIRHKQKDIQNQGLSVVVASNPRNPTGQAVMSVPFSIVISIPPIYTVDAYPGVKN